MPPACVDAAVAGVEADYAAALAAIPDGRAEDRGVAAVGRRGGDPRSAGDGSRSRATDGGQALLTGDPLFPRAHDRASTASRPGTPFAFAPQLGEMAPFVLRDGSQFRPARRTR